MNTTDETVTYTRSRARLPINTYSLGNKTMSRRIKHLETTEVAPVVEGIDFFDTLKELTTDPAIHLLSDLIQGKCASTNLVKYDTSNMSPSDKNRVSKGYKQLESMKLVVRVKRGLYLINPRLSPSYPDYFDRVCLHWVQLTGELP